ncbi:hypothetical protein MPSI1_002678 [Malassezia psittaci]|uniref:Uncharacterized protein n=1 Tax=Malassezia psittaci TaxID=1821823 RepID=A0AAF0F7B5_9BASI|nr:hypothetical protein MPSI1_002678 [Malassezia psittaci]
MHRNYEVASNAPVVVMGGTLLATTAGGLTGVVSGVLQSTYVPPAVMGLRLARGWFMFSFGFFGKGYISDAAIREYLVRPALYSGSSPEFRSAHTQNLKETFLAGSVMGALTAAYLRRPVIPGLLTLTGLCTGVQFLSNELFLAVSRIGNGSSTIDQQQIAAEANSSVTSSETPETAASGNQPPTQSRSSVMKFLEKHDLIIPLTDKQYKERLLQRRSEIDRELILLDQELAQERRQLHQLETQAT